MLRRRQRRRNREKEVEGTTNWSDESKTPSRSSTHHTKNDSSEDTRTGETPHTSRQKSLNLFEEPGPAIATDGALETLHRKCGAYPVPQRYSHRTSEPTWSDASSDPFRSPVDGDIEPCQPTNSKIGLALSRYSTADTTGTFAVCRPPSPTKPATTFDVLRGQPHNVNMVQLNRDSSLSARTDDKHNEDKVEICNARLVPTARRHSLTPRIINIVASRNSSKDRASMGSDESSERGRGAQIATRARSASPTKVQLAYTGSPAKLNAHFGIETWEMQHCRMSPDSLELEHMNSNGSISKRPYERARGPSRERHINYPPTSYPKLGRTLSAVKRTIRANKDGAFSAGGNGSN